MYFAKPHPGDVTIKTSYGITSNGTAVDEYVLTNANGMEVKIINYGGIITSIRVPDRHGNMANVVLGFNNLHDYETQSPFFGCITGRYANRIAEGKFTLDGVDYTLAQNDGPNSLHGGLKGFDKAVWNAAQVNGSLELTHLSPDMDEGFPGKLNVKVTYALTDQNELVIDYTATTDKPTIVNLTNHSYFNLLGEGMGAIYDHILMLNADHYTPTNSNLIPTGELAPVEGTPFDFRLPKVIGPGQRSSHEQIRAAHGYDHNFVLSRPSADDTSLMLAARVYEPQTGRMMEVWTTEPAIQFYAGNFINATLVGTSDSHPIFQSALTEGEYRNWFSFDDSLNGYQSFFGNPGMPQLNLAYGPARDWMIGIACRWLRDFDVDGYRLDYANGPGPDFWSDFRAACKAEKPDCFLFGEVVDAPDMIKTYVGRLDGCLDFHLGAALRQTYGWQEWPVSRLQTFINRHYTYFPSDFLLPTFLDNHDMDRFLFIAGGDKQQLRRAAAVQMSLPGIPIIFYGTEVGLSQQVSTGGGMGLHVSRTPMLWGDDQDHGLLAYYQSLIQKRKQHQLAAFPVAFTTEI